MASARDRRECGNFLWQKRGWQTERITQVVGGCVKFLRAIESVRHPPPVASYSVSRAAWFSFANEVSATIWVRLRDLVSCLIKNNRGKLSYIFGVAKQLHPVVGPEEEAHSVRPAARAPGSEHAKIRGRTRRRLPAFYKVAKPATAPYVVQLAADRRWSIMTPDQFGKLLALLNAVVWAIALIFFKRSGSRVPPLALNLFKNSIGIAAIAATIALGPWVVSTMSLEVPRQLLNPAESPFWILVISGVIGIALADSIFFYGLNLAGVGLTAIVDCLYTPFMLLFSWLMLSEKIGPIHLIGAAFIMSAVFLSTGHQPPPDRTRRQILAGMLLCATAIGLMAFGIVLAKPVLHQELVLWTSLIRMIAGNVALLLVVPWLPGWKAVLAAFTPSRDWRFTIPGSFFGAYLAMIFWVGGITYTDASIAAMLNQTSSVFALILAALILRERLSPAKIAAILCAFAGICIVTFHERVAQWIAAAQSAVGAAQSR